MVMIAIIILWILSILFGSVGLNILISFLMKSEILEILPEETKNKFWFTLIVLLWISFLLFYAAITISGGKI